MSLSKVLVAVLTVVATVAAAAVVVVVVLAAEVVVVVAPVLPMLAVEEVVVVVEVEVRSMAHWTKPNKASKSGLAASLVPGVSARACFSRVDMTRPTGAVR